MSKIKSNKAIIIICLGVFGFICLVFIYKTFSNLKKSNISFQSKTDQLSYKNRQLLDQLNRINQLNSSISAQLSELKSQDQYLINKTLENENKLINQNYKKAVAVYESLLKLQEQTKKTDDYEKEYAQSLNYLADRNYSSASALLIKLDKNINNKLTEIASGFKMPENLAVKNSPPGSGYSRQRVDTPVGSYMVDIIASDLNSTRVIVDTASNETCRNNCPVDSLAGYVLRSGGYGGINGPYFCPAAYPSCTGKTNSFDTLIMNKNKVYFNSDNNVYSTVPAVIFSGNSGRFVGQSLQWGRDTGVDAVISSQPMLTSGGNRVFGGDGEPKRSGKGSRSFIGTTGSTVYIGVVHNVSTAEMAYVIQTLGISDSLNLDSGGSTALYYQGKYLVGPGRNTPFGIVLVRK